MEEIIYNEIQKVNNKWIWILLALLSIIFISAFSEQIILSQSVGNNTAPDWSIGFFGLIPLIMLFLIMSIKFQTLINKEGIQFKFSPFHQKFRKIKWSEIDKFYIRKYNPISEYGGWGIRTLSFKKNIAYNITGNIGLQIELKSGKKILLGTQKNDELEQIISEINYFLHPNHQ